MGFDVANIIFNMSNLSEKISTNFLKPYSRESSASHAYFNTKKSINGFEIK